MSARGDSQPRIARFYTSITRIPLLIGKAGESRIPGGPYNPAQLIVGGLVLLAGWNTMSLWGPLVSSLPLIRILTLIVAAAFCTWASGQLPTSRRKIHNLAFDFTGALTAPTAGKLNGRPVRFPLAHGAGRTVLIEADDSNGDLDAFVGQAEEAVAPPAATAPALPLPDISSEISPPEQQAPVAPSPAFASGLDRLLTQARVKEG